MRLDARSIARALIVRKWILPRYDRPMGKRTGAVLLGVLLILGGLVWMAQGLDLEWAPSSFMTADRLWVFLGAVAVLAGVVLIGWSRQRNAG
jgi:uncharacterized membrane protein